LAGETPEDEDGTFDDEETAEAARLKKKIICIMQQYNQTFLFQEIYLFQKSQHT
jgi:hypothetical protein